MPRMVQVCSDPWFKAPILESKTFQCNTKEELPLSAFPFLFLQDTSCLCSCASMSSLGSAVLELWCLQYQHSLSGAWGGLLGPQPLGLHTAISTRVLFFPSQRFTGAAWHLGTVTALVDGARGDMPLEGQLSQTLQWCCNRLKWDDQASSTDWGSS